SWGPSGGQQRGARDPHATARAKGFARQIDPCFIALLIHEIDLERVVRANVLRVDNENVAAPRSLNRNRALRFKHPWADGHLKASFHQSRVLLSYVLAVLWLHILD